MKIKRIVIDICEACLAGEGEMCHTPECALCRHSVDLPIWPELYHVVHEYDSTTTDEEIVLDPVDLDPVDRIVRRENVNWEAVAKSKGQPFQTITAEQLQKQICDKGGKAAWDRLIRREAEMQLAKTWAEEAKS